MCGGMLPTGARVAETPRTELGSSGVRRHGGQGAAPPGGGSGAREPCVGEPAWWSVFARLAGSSEESCKGTPATLQPCNIKGADLSRPESCKIISSQH